MRSTLFKMASAKVLWGLENYREQEIKTLVITEGEIDCLSVVSAINSEAATKGIDPDSCLVLSVPNGAPQRVSNKRVDAKDDRKFSYLWHSKEIFESAEKIILALDDDEPGVALGEEIMRRVGRAKCYHLELPDNCKDSNDILRKHGAGMLVDLIREATPTPLVGVYSAADYSDDVNFLYERGLMGGKSTGFRDLDSLYTVLQGQLTVVTGLPGSGKSEWVDAVMVNLAEQHDWKFAVASFENPPPLHIIKLCEKRARLPFFEGRNERMTEDQMAEARSWVNEHFAFLDSKDGEPATVGLNHRANQDGCVEAGVQRFGDRSVQLHRPNPNRKRTSVDQRNVNPYGSVRTQSRSAHMVHRTPCQR